MKKVVMLVLIGLTLVLAGENEQIKETFTGIEEINIKTVSGDCILLPSNGKQVEVELEYSVNKEKAFEPEIRQNGETLNIREHWSGSSSGNVKWTLRIPEAMEVAFSSASGDLTVEDVDVELDASTASGDINLENTKSEIEASTASGDVILDQAEGEFDVSTASGDIKIENVAGEIDLSTASGDIEIDGATGELDVSCASGDIEAENVILKQDGSFSTASGSVMVTLAKSAEFNLELSSASGDVVLDYNGNPMKGKFVLCTRKKDGKIVSSEAFDEEKENEHDGQIYLEKSFTKGADSPEIRIETSSGRAELKK